MKKTRILAILLCLSMLFSLAACGGGGNKEDTTSPDSGGSTPAGDTSTGTSPSGDTSQTGPADSGGAERDTLSIAVRDDTGSLSPVTLVSQMYQAAVCVQEPMWDVTEDGEVIMLLAESVEIAEPDRWIVHLRQGVTFSNGNPFTAEDVVFSIKLHAAAGATGGPRVQSVDVEKVSVIDEHTVNLQLLSYHVANWTILSQMIVYDEESYNAEQAGVNPIGTGPYVVTEYVPNSHVNMERREDYWGGTPAIKYLRFRILNETAQVVNALETGMIDIGLLSTDDVEYVSTLPDYRIDSRYTGNYILLGYNFGESSAFHQNLDARKAIAHSINSQAIIDLVYGGQGEIMHCCTPDLCFDYEERFNDLDDTYKIGYNVDLAKQYADSSGLTGKTITVITDGSANSVAMAEIIQSMIAAIGVTVEINNYDPATVWAMLYDPTSTYDLSIGAGIAPNRRVGDQLVNGVRYSPTLTIPGAFEDNMRYLEIAPLTLSTADDQERSDMLYEVLKMYVQNVISFALCNVLYSNAFSTDIDPSTISYMATVGQVRISDLRFLP